jgi:hypothetical protein
MRRYLACRFAYLLLITLLVCIQPAVAAADDDEWILDQQNHASGLYKIYVTAKAMKIVSIDAGYQIICKAPDWEVVSCRPDEKIFHKESLTTTYRLLNYVSPSASNTNRKDQNLGKETSAGVKLVKYGNSYERYWMLDGVHVAPQLSNLLLAYYHLSPVDGFLFNYSCAVKIPNGRMDTWEYRPFEEQKATIALVKTLKMRKLKLQATDFEYPKNFKLVSLEQVFRASKSQTQALDSLMDDMGVGKKFSK